jgi:putative transposase
LIASPNRFTCTEAARTQPEETDAAHDAYTRLLQRLPDNTNLLWEESKELITFKGVLLIDDSVLDKPFANKIELVSYFWSGNHHQVVKGIDLITAL